MRGKLESTELETKTAMALLFFVLLRLFKNTKGKSMKVREEILFKYQWRGGWVGLGEVTELISLKRKL